jgi:hypothetical protein
LRDLFVFNFDKERTEQQQSSASLTGQEQNAQQSVITHPESCLQAQSTESLQGLREFSSAEILGATANFSELVGKGGFGKVYKGNYHHSCVAVKVLNTVRKRVLLYHIHYCQLKWLAFPWM